MFASSARKLFSTKVVITLIVAAFAMIAGIFAPLMASWSLYRLVFVFFVLLVIPALIVVTGTWDRAFLFALIFAIPLNLVLTPFSKGPAHLGGAQPTIQFYLYDFPLVGLLAAWILEIPKQKMSVRKSGVLLSAILWILWSVLSMYNSAKLTLSWFEILRMVKLCLLMLAVSTLVRDSRDMRVVFVALLLSLFFQSFACVVQYNTGSFFNLFSPKVVFAGDLTRVTGTMDQSNTTGAFLATMTAMALMLFVCNTDRMLNSLSLIAALAGFISLILTYSRGAWVSFLAALACGILVARIKRWLNSRDIFRLVMIGVVIITVALTINPNIMLRLNQTYIGQEAIAVRFSLMKIAENMVIAHPILGVGINTFVEVMRYYDSTGISYLLLYPVHDVYLLIAAETGVAGLALFLIFLGNIFRDSFRAVKNSNRVISSPAICLMSGLIAILVSNLADVHLKGETIFALFWLLAGLTISLGRRSQTGGEIRSSN